MEEFTSVEESGYSDSTSPISEPPDIRNWFPSYVYESLPMSSSVNEIENEVNKANLDVTVSNKDDNKPMCKNMKQSPDRSLYDSLPSEPPDLGNWFSSYVYESPMLDTSDGFELSVPGESECIKETEADKETTKFDRKLVSSARVTDLSQSESALSEPPDLRNWFSSYEYQSPQLSDTHEFGFSSFEKDQLIVEESDPEDENTSGNSQKTMSKQETIAHGRLNSNDYKENIAADTVTDVSQSQSALSELPDLRNWFSSYEYQSPQLSDTHEFGFSSFEKDQLIVDESDTEDENTFGIFRKTMSKQETIAQGRLNSNDYKVHIAADTAKEVSSDNASETEVKQESSFKQEPLFCEPKEESRFSPGVSQYNPKRKSPSKNAAYLHEQRPKHIQETIFINSNRQNYPIDEELDDKENVHEQSTETGFVTIEKARFREARGRCSKAKPNTGVLVECSRSKGLKKIAGEEDKEERNKKRRVLGEMSNHQSSGAEEIAGKWHCPQKNKRNIVPPLKQLRLDTWIHKV